MVDVPVELARIQGRNRVGISALWMAAIRDSARRRLDQGRRGFGEC